MPLRPLNLGDIFPGVIASIRGNPKATMGLTLLICLAFLVLACPLKPSNKML